MKKKKHIHDDPRIDCPACVDLIRAPLPRIYPYPESSLDKKRRELMDKMIDYEFAKIKGSKILRTQFGELIWIPKSK